MYNATSKARKATDLARAAARLEMKKFNSPLWKTMRPNQNVNAAAVRNETKKLLANLANYRAASASKTMRPNKNVKAAAVRNETKKLLANLANYRANSIKKSYSATPRPKTRSNNLRNIARRPESGIRNMGVVSLTNFMRRQPSKKPPKNQIK
jgi:hypothetical protein